MTKGQDDQVFLPGHKPGRQCTVCRSDQRDKVNAMLGTGASSPLIAAKFGFSESAVKRHRRKHMQVKAVKDVSQATEGEVDKLMTHLRSIIGQSIRIFNEAEAPKDPKTKLAALAEVRRSVEAQAKILGIVNDGATVNVMQNVEVNEKWVAIRTALMRALARHPEALDDVVQALAEVDALG